MTRILLCNNPENLDAALRDAEARGLKTATVEAEYGDIVIEGSEWTLAHHGPRKGSPAPCLTTNLAPDDLRRPDVIGLSHFDLDALGGTLALMGVKPENPDFWALAGWVDINGAHQLGQAGWAAGDVRDLQAWWAWNQDHKIYPPHDGSVADVTAEVLVSRGVLSVLLTPDEEDREQRKTLLNAGGLLRDAEEMLNRESFLCFVDDVIVRVAPTFVNHLYARDNGEVGKAVVAYNTIDGTITVSLADPIPGISCREMVQALWGEKAGGHDGIAGGPRGARMNLMDLHEAVKLVSMRIRCAVLP